MKTLIPYLLTLVFISCGSPAKKQERLPQSIDDEGITISHGERTHHIKIKEHIVAPIKEYLPKNVAITDVNIDPKSISNFIGNITGENSISQFSWGNKAFLVNHYDLEFNGSIKNGEAYKFKCLLEIKISPKDVSLTRSEIFITGCESEAAYFRGSIHRTFYELDIPTDYGTPAEIEERKQRKERLKNKRAF